MSDEEILRLFYLRSEEALAAVWAKYGRLCSAVARNILGDERDVEECVNDTWIRAWNSIPPENPKSLSAYLSRISRNLALDRYAYNQASKRASSLTLAFEELEGCLPVKLGDPECFAEGKAFRETLNGFLRSQSKEARIFFVRRYWYGESTKEIAAACHVTDMKVRTSLSRTRMRLRVELQKEGISV